ncbi:arabinose-5-phosphate isomerase [Paenibacillus sp. LBL]|uniref:KpsF/GutQ family sugar-phosphate isomerase n=1 Tax=Paenibacillus sp. LBL TaxID=2940563 RepID=UPI0024756526|nr:KpsF/GutQ family sugar-phosphate isomerase [Paenibacillus sp. LBL]MDH6674548.1 arabinose-5-phosphate isomerase [Paenibacillus sp. LBL]
MNTSYIDGTDMIFQKAQDLLEEEIEAIQQTKELLDDNFIRAISLMNECTGKLIVTGIGKSGHAARKMAATMVSLGITAVYLNPAEAVHGDLGIVQENDIVIGISKSGESKELIAIYPAIKSLKASIITITANPYSKMAQYSDVVLRIGIKKEAGHLNLAPTSSVIASLALGDALATIVAEMKGFSEEQFAVYHPGGALGEGLTMKVEDLLTVNHYSAVEETGSFQEILIELTTKRIGATVVMRNDNIVGIITDGDLKRLLEKYQEESFKLVAKNISESKPTTIQKGTKVIDAIRIMERRDHPISVLPVLDGSRYLGTLRIHDVLRGL